MTNKNLLPHQTVKKIFNLNFKAIYICYAIILLMSFKSPAIVFSELTPNDCLIQLEKATTFLEKLQYKLAIVSKNNLTAWLKHSDGKWFKLVTHDEISTPYPIKIIKLSNNFMILEVMISPFCYQRYTLERQHG